jgi:hypothetical protein
MTTLYSPPSERCQGNNDNDGDLARELRKGACSETEELYWFARALTGDPEFAASLVADTKAQAPTGRGIFRN